MKKHYFISYGAIRRDDHRLMYWNDVIDITPMEFIERNQVSPDNLGDENYKHFHIVSCTEITEADFKKWKDKYDVE